MSPSHSLKVDASPVHFSHEELDFAVPETCSMSVFYGSSLCENTP
jgi:hypothetical protein